MPPGPEDRLDSWKEIAAYAQRGVRTVRRWEREEGLPVHRHLHRKLGSVYAFKSEIDAWRQSAARSGRSPTTAARLSGAAAARARAIAVLPFTNLSADPENEHMAAGLADEIRATLSQLRVLRVISRTSSSAVRGRTADARAIAAELDVKYLLEGSVRRAGSRLRITVQLIDARADDHLWADTYDGDVEDVFTIQERLARRIVEALELRLTADEDRRLAERPIDHLHAYECYLRARQEGWRWRQDAIDHAVRLLRNGLETVGDNARLYAALGLAFLQYREAGIDVGEGPILEAEACERKVSSLAPASAAGLQLRGWLHYSRGRVQEAVRELKAALELDPSNADTLLLLSNCYLISGHVEIARPLIARLLAVDPLTPLTRCMPAWADILEGDAAAALEPYRKMFEMDPSNPMARLFYVWVLVLNRRAAEAEAVLAAFPPEMRKTVPARIAFFLAHALAGEGRKAASAVTREIESMADATDVFSRFLAQGFALAGMPERALHWLAVAIDRGFINHPFLSQHDPFFRGLRDDPRFAALMDTVRRRWEAFEA